MARELDWTQIYLWRRLSGKVPFNVNDLAAIAAVLEVPVTAFFEPPVGSRSLQSSTLRPALASAA